jgi:hypothetical protein
MGQPQGRWVGEECAYRFFVKSSSLSPMGDGGLLDRDVHVLPPHPHVTGTHICEKRYAVEGLLC